VARHLQRVHDTPLPIALLQVSARLIDNRQRPILDYQQVTDYP
jgi:hypothetical protein